MLHKRAIISICAFHGITKQITTPFQKFLLCHLLLTELLLVIAICDIFGNRRDSLDIGFFTFLRFSVCGLSAWLAKWHLTRQILCFFLVAFAVLFNPVIPIRLDRESWLLFDIIAVPLLFFSALPLFRQKEQQKDLQIKKVSIQRGE